MLPLEQHAADQRKRRRQHDQRAVGDRAERHDQQDEHDDERDRHDDAQRRARVLGVLDRARSTRASSRPAASGSCARCCRALLDVVGAGDVVEVDVDVAGELAVVVADHLRRFAHGDVGDIAERQPTGHRR